MALGERGNRAIGPSGNWAPRGRRPDGIPEGPSGRTVREGSALEHYAIRDWPEGERPRERLLSEGPRRLTTAELLAIVLQTGARGQSAVDLALTLLRDWEGLAGLEAADPHVLIEAKGLGPAKVAQIKAALELGRRLLAAIEEEARPRITSSKDVVELMAPRLRGLQVERCELILLNGGNEVLRSQALSEGSLTESAVYPRDMMELANRHHAAAVILVHNHPSGNAQPSASDRTLTQELVLAGELLRIRMLDHVILGRRDHFSFADRGLIEEYRRRPAAG